jgi:DnaJ homolog subfamily B member 6
VRRAFKQKALETHPDKLLELGASDNEMKAAEARFHKVREAFEVLNDPQRRRSYSPHHTHHTLKDCVL